MPTTDLRTCPQGHRYRKSSECPTCPACEQLRKPADGVLSGLSAPARRALERIGATTIAQLAKHREADILALHGMGPNSVAKLRAALEQSGKTFLAP